MLGMLVVILSGIRFAADIIVPFIWRCFIAVVLQSVVQRMTRCRIPRVVAVSAHCDYCYVNGTATGYLGTSLNELARTLPQYRSSLVIPLQRIEPWLRQSSGIGVCRLMSFGEICRSNAAMTLDVSLLTQRQCRNRPSFVLLTVVFMLLEVPQLPEKLQQMMSRPAEGMAAIQRA